MPAKAKPLIVESLPREDGQLSIVRVEPGLCVMSNGEELLIRWGKEYDLCVQLCQERAAVSYRPWRIKEGSELVEVHRTPAAATASPRVVPNGGDSGQPF